MNKIQKLTYQLTITLTTVICFQVAFAEPSPFSETHALAKQGDAEAQFNLGVIYANGKYDTTQNYQKAFVWFLKSAEQKHAKAQTNVAIMLDKGLGVSENHELAIQWYFRAAENGDSKAQYNLGAMYVSGEGVSQNYDLAENLLSEAAANGNRDAQFMLGSMYYLGNNIKPDKNKAEKLISKSCHNGHVTACETKRFLFKN